MLLPKFWCIKINIIAANLALFEIIQVGYSDGQIVVGDVQLHSARCRTSSSPVAASHIALRTASQLASVAGNLMSMFHDIYLFILFPDPSVSSIVIVCCFSRNFFASKLAGICPIGVHTCPTNCTQCAPSVISATV